ncbi:MAG: PAS domain S-box protein [Elusimicrobiales bacterium]|nr:PAS domain S-box protein [Elusimicrobiales bacterium]
MGGNNPKQDHRHGGKPGETEGQLLEGVSALRRILDYAAFPAAIVNSDDVFESYNRKAEEAFGYSRAEVPDMAHWWVRAYPEVNYREETKKRWLASVQKARQGNGEIERGEYRVTCKDGSVKVCCFFGSIIEGKAFIVLEDITARSLTETALRDSEATLRRIIDKAPMSMAIVNVDGTIEYINQKAEETFGFPNSEIPTMDHWWRLAYPDEAYRKEVIARFMGHVSEAMEKHTEIAGEEYLVTCKDGSKKTCFIFGVIAAGKIFVMFDDITQRVEAVNTIRDSEKTLRRILELAPIAISVQSLGGEIEFINRKFSETFGYAREDITDYAVFKQRFFPDEAYRQEVYGIWKGWVQQSLESGREMPGGQFRINCKSGMTKDIYITGMTTPDKKVISLFEDITVRNQAAREIAENARTLRRTLEQAPVCIAIHDMAGRIEFINSKFVQTFGYKHEEIPDLETWTRRAYPEESYRKRLTAIWREWQEKSMRTGLEMDGGEFKVVCRDGATKTVFITGVVTADRKVVSLLEDVTARVETERALRERESLYRALIETTGTGYVVLDGHGRVQDANREYVRLSGHSDLKEIMGRSVLEWSAPQNQDRAREAIAIVMREGRLVNFEVDYSDKAGKHTTIEINATVVARGGVQQILGLCRDVSARSKTEAELRDSESLYRALIETTRTGYVVIDTQGKVTDANREYVRLAGRSDLKEILGRSALDWTSPEHQEANAAAIARCARDGYIFNHETEYIDAKGKRTPVEVNATVVNRRGMPQIHTLCRDITDRRRAEAELQSLNQGLEKRVEERTAELSAANMELTMEIAQRIDAERGRSKLQEELLQSQKMEVVGRLAGGIAHDFNNILVAISGYAEMLLKTAPEGGTAKDDLNEIIRETERGALLTRQLTTISRRQPLELEELCLNTVVEDSCKMLKRLIGANMHLRLQLAPDLAPVRADQGQIAQVIMNLVVNARDAMPDGGDIKLVTANEEIAVPPQGLPLVPAAGGYVTLMVTDTGTGMAPETAAHIFEPFYTTKPEGKGTGLGLSTVYAILQQCKGGIGLSSAPGKGTTFKLYFPRAGANP